jgi:hypothetical protein
MLLNFSDMKQICLVIFLWTSSKGLFVDWENELKITDGNFRVLYFITYNVTKQGPFAFLI